MKDVDEDDTRDAIEACLYADIIGLPMSQRLALRCAPSRDTSTSSWKEQVKCALSLNVKNFDICEQGLEGVSVECISKLLDEEGHKFKTLK